MGVSGGCEGLSHYGEDRNPPRKGRDKTPPRRTLISFLLLSTIFGGAQHTQYVYCFHLVLNVSRVTWIIQSAPDLLPYDSASKTCKIALEYTCLQTFYDNEFALLRRERGVLLIRLACASSFHVRVGGGGILDRIIENKRTISSNISIQNEPHRTITTEEE